MEGSGYGRKDICSPEMSLDYNEKADALAIRINAHKKYSNFSLEDWLRENLPFKKSNIILDVGCGNGNFLPTYSELIGETGIIVGLDKSKDIIKEAKTRDIPTPKVIIEADMNSYLPFAAGCFDYVISTFAIYYAKSEDFIYSEVKRVLKMSGQFLFLGPTDKNAKELHNFNKAVFGFKHNNKLKIRTNRLEREFYSHSKNFFHNITIEKIQRKIVFPDKKEFVEYYMATLLFEESVQKAGYLPNKKSLIELTLPSLEISKEMVLLKGEKC